MKESPFGHLPGCNTQSPCELCELTQFLLDQNASADILYGVCRIAANHHGQPIELYNSIELLELGKRLETCLKRRHGIKTIGDLTRLTSYEVSLLNGIGPKSLAWINAKLRRCGRHLATKKAE